MTHITCRLTAKNREQLRNPMLGNRVWATFLLQLEYITKINGNDESVFSYGDNVALPAHHCCCGPVLPWQRPCSSQLISPTCLAQSSKPAACCCSGRIGETDGQTPYHYRDPALHTMQTVPIRNESVPKIIINDTTQFF